MKIDYVQNVETRLKMRSYNDLWKQLTESISEALNDRLIDNEENRNYLRNRLEHELRQFESNHRVRSITPYRDLADAMANMALASNNSRTDKNAYIIMSHGRGIGIINKNMPRDYIVKLRGVLNHSMFPYSIISIDKEHIMEQFNILNESLHRIFNDITDRTPIPAPSSENLGIDFDCNDDGYMV